MAKNLVGPPVTGDDFIGRKNEIERAISILEQGNSILLASPRRVGKSSFVKRFMEVLILDNIDNEEEKKRVLDSLPQIGEGKTIMTMEPKFVPMNGVEVRVFDSTSVKVRMIDSVGYIIDNSNGYLEDGKMRMVKTPWFHQEIPFFVLFSPFTRTRIARIHADFFQTKTLKTA